jgi:hypothetical protein
LHQLGDAITRVFDWKQTKDGALLVAQLDALETAINQPSGDLAPLRALAFWLRGDDSAELHPALGRVQRCVENDQG